MAFSDPQKNIEAMGLHEGSVVADLGAGSGFYTLAAGHAVGPGGKVYSVDVQAELLARIKNSAHTQHLHNIEVIHGDVEVVGGTRLREVSVDAVFVCNILFQLEHKDGLVDEVKRILKPGGRVLIIDWEGSFGGMGPTQKDIVEERDAAALFEGHGFTKITAFDAGDHHYGLIYRKD
jgi:ubiquinone/menaquinone biosynthesis C-methylase UbiE